MDGLQRLTSRRNDVATLALFRLDPSVLTQLAVSPTALETFPGVRRDEIADTATILSAIDAILASKPEPREDPLDARYGLVFLDGDGQRVFAAYKGRFASAGQIDEQPVTYAEPALDGWLDHFESTVATKS